MCRGSTLIAAIGDFICSCTVHVALYIFIVYMPYKIAPVTVVQLSMAIKSGHRVLIFPSQERPLRPCQRLPQNP